jgi:putative addiction module component (TIGR02574 family)
MLPDILKKARELDIADRIKLVEAIWDTLEEDAGPDVVPVPEWHRSELDRRLREMDEAGAEGETWEVIRKRLR